MNYMLSGPTWNANDLDGPLGERMNRDMSTHPDGNVGSSILPKWLAAMTGFQNSWQRCSTHHGLDPSARPEMHRLSARELRDVALPLEAYLPAITAELNFVQSVLAGEGYFSSFSNTDGVILEYRDGGSMNPSVDKRERAGVIWCESVAGTNGVGTCLAERRPVAVVREEHFFEAFSDLTCFSVPVLSPAGDIIGVFNITSTARQLSTDAMMLSAGLVIRSAERLGNEIFSEFYHNDTVLRLVEDGQTMLLALDEQQRIICANRAAQQAFSIEPDGNHTLWALFQRSETALRDLESAEGRILLRHHNRSEHVSVSLRRPVQHYALRINATPASSEKGIAGAPAPSASVKRAPDTTQTNLPLGFGPLEDDPVRLRQLRRAANNGLPILLLGETGTGKDTMARAIHADGDRASAPFVALNCGAIPESLIDSELFGYAAGAFTGARREGQPGRVQQADGGTIFLDEIGDMPLPLQARLLRFLETGEASPLGAGKTQKLSVRVIAATNHDLPERVAAGRFRHDLYFRLAGLVVELPPLRGRNDFDELTNRLLSEVSDGGAMLELAGTARQRLLDHDWPGNVRELKFVLQRAAYICENGIISEDDISFVNYMRPN